MSRIRYVLVTLCLFATISATTAAHARAATGSWVDGTAPSADPGFQLMSSAKGYAYEVPSTWRSLPPSRANTDTAFGSPDGNAGAFVQVVSQSSVPDPQNFIANFQRNAAANFPSYRSIAAKNIPVAGADTAFLAGGTYTDQGTQWDLFISVSVRGMTLYNFVIQVTDDFNVANSGLLGQIGGSFQLTD
jgi:hypothetical protein